MQPHIPDLDVDPDEAFQLVFRELKRHGETGRRNFVVRAPVDLLEYLFSAILRKSGMSRVSLELQLARLGVYGFKEEDGRILRRYLSGHTRMAWSTYQRLMLWALSSGWINTWVFRDLAFRSYEREASQLCARKIVNTFKRRTTLPDWPGSRLSRASMRSISLGSVSAIRLRLLACEPTQILESLFCP